MELNALLGEFNEESQARLRTAVAQLADVPTDEQCRVIEEFLAALESEVQAAGTPSPVDTVKLDPRETRDDVSESFEL